MNITPDPTTVREIAEDAMRGAIRDGMFWHVNQAVIEHGVPGPASKGSTFEVHRSAAIAEYKRMADAPSWPDEQPQDERECVWHELRRFSGPHPLDGDEVEQHELTHPEQCHTLPPGAACWAEHQPFRWWWPTAHGTYRIRPEDVLTGGSEDGPDYETTLRVQVRGEGTAAGEWFEYSNDYVNPAAVKPVGDAEQDERDGDVRAVMRVIEMSDTHYRELEVATAVDAMRERFADRIAALEARDAKAGE